MTSFTERNPKLIGAVVIVVAAAVVAGVLLLNRSVFTPSYTIHARFADAAGIGKGAEVTVAGVKVGTVQAVHVEGNAVVADLAIDHSIVLPARTAAAIQVQTVLGVLDVALQPQSGWDHPLRPGATITDTSVPVEFQDLQDTAGNLLQHSDVQAFNQLLSSLAKVTQGKQAQVAAIIDGLDRFTGVIDARRGEVSNLIDEANVLAATVAQHDQQLAGAIDDLATVVQGLASHSADLQRLVDDTEQFAAQTASLVGQNQPQLQGLLDHLHAVLQVIAQHQEDLAQGVSYLSSALTGFQSVGYSGPQNTPNTWANIYTNLLGTAGAYSVLGNCGALDQALDQVFGPDPLACDARSGPLPGTSTPPSGGPALQGQSAAGSAPSGTAPAASTTAGTGAGGVPEGAGATSVVQQLLGQLLGG